MAEPGPTSMLSFILIHHTVWPQYTNVTDRQDGQTDRQDNPAIAQGEPFYKRSPKDRHKQQTSKNKQTSKQQTRRNTQSTILTAEGCQWRKCPPYMGALAAAGWARSARGDPRYGGKWAWLAGRGRCTASSWAQRAVHVDWGFSSISDNCR